MGTKILEDIRNDLKLLIKCITGFEEDEEGFVLCERYALSQVKHHRYLSVNGHAVRKEISEVVKKFQIHGKYEVAEKFQELVDSFLNNFDFERHPQYDLQWSLLSLLFNLSTDTSKSDLSNLEQIANVPSDDNKPEDIDWARYLKEGQDEFFCDYQSTSDSDWSDEDEVEGVDSSKTDQLEIPSTSKDLIANEANETKNTLHKLSECITNEFDSRNWLATNVQHSWWNELDWHQHPNTSQVPSATLCEFWRKNTLKSPHIISTLSEYQTCRELLWMFHVQEPMAIFQSQNALDFSVRDNISIPSLTVASFKSILVAYCDYFGMIRELEEFAKRLYSQDKRSEEVQKPPLTYEAYNAAVQQYLLKMKEEIVRIEQNFMAQEGSNTFLTISKELRKHLNFIRMLYEIHQSVTANWETCSNWIRTSKLLSTLYYEMQNSSSHEKTNICANLYLSSITVYLNIIDVWLSEGRLEDWREEFVIVRERERRSQEEGKLYKRFTVRELDEKCSKDPIMQLLLQKVCQMGRSIELLVTLDRLSDMWDTMNDRNAKKVSLNEEFRREVVSESSKYNVLSVYDTTDMVLSRRQTAFLSHDFDQSILHQVPISDNPFLMKAFENYLPIDGSRADAVDETDLRSDENKGMESFVRFELISKSILPLRKVFENALSRILDFRYISASKLVKEIMIREYKLEENLKLMRSVYMMERGHIMNRFCNQIFNEIESNIAWNNSYFLSCILEEIISEEWPDLSSRWSITVDNIRTHHVLHAANGITLHFAIGWPINMLLNEDTLSKYNSIFRFELKLKWALWTLNNLRFADLEGSKSKEVTDALEHFHMRRLECLRFWLLHAIGAIHVYLSGQVLHSLGNALESELAQADNLDSIIKIHKEYLNKVHEHCLQTSQFEDLMSTINQLLEMCAVIRDSWKTGTQKLEGKQLDLLESTYIKYHTYLALALHNAVQHHNATYYRLTPQLRVELIKKYIKGRKKSNRTVSDHVLDMSQNLITEVAYQNLPPSGLPFPMSILIQKRLHWKRTGASLQLFEHLPLNECEQKFSFLSCYYRERIIATSSSPCISFDLSEDAIQEINSSEFNIGVSESIVLESEEDSESD